MNKKILSLAILTISFIFVFINILLTTFAEDKIQLAPITEVSSQDKIEINPQAENPVLINKEPLKVDKQETGKLPIFSVDVQTTTDSASESKSPLETPSTTVIKQPLQIEVDKETKEIVIKQEETVVKTKEPINVESNNLTIQTPEGKMPINILPNTVTKMAIKKEPQKVDEINLKVINKQPIYETKGFKEEKVLNLIPIKMPITIKISAETGKVIEIEKPLWAKLLDPISF